MLLKLTHRLQAIADFVRTGGIVCDIGTDHALLPCYLSHRGARVIAADINDGPLQIAAENIKAYNATSIELVKSDGLEGVSYADDIIIAGMGGELIVKIVSKCGFLHENLRLILQPMTKTEFVREELSLLGFKTLSEKVVRESGRLFVIMLMEYTGKPLKISKAEALTGQSGDRDYINGVLSKLERIKETLEKTNNQKHQEKLAELNKIIKEIRNNK